MTKNSFKYLTIGEEDLLWGLFINVAGSSTTKPFSEYPSGRHPSGYYFDWDEGRILQEYQVNYITSGSGVFENKYGKYNVKPGSLLIIHPGEWHRYKPNKKDG
mgnify:CR=1 FL=1